MRQTNKQTDKQKRTSRDDGHQLNVKRATASHLKIIILQLFLETSNRGGLVSSHLMISIVFLISNNRHNDYNRNVWPAIFK